MDRTPKSRHNTSLSISRADNRPGHSTPEASTSRNIQRDISSVQYSPIDSPGSNEYLSQEYKVYWGWKSPDEIAIKKPGANFKADFTPKYLSPKPKRKLIRQNYTDKLRNWAEEFKFFQEELKNVTAGKHLESKSVVNEKELQEQSSEIVCATVTKDVPFSSRKDAPEPCVQVEDAPSTGKACEPIPQDCLVVELTQGLTSLKSFPTNHQFPTVPKLDLENEMNRSDYVILMEDNSIEDEMIKCTQQIEEQILCQKQVTRNEKGKTSMSSSKDDSNVMDALNKFTDYITSPKSVTSPLIATKSPLLSRRLSSGRKSAPSPKNGESFNSSKRLNMKVSWDSDCYKVDVKKLEPSKEEEVMCMLEDDSFDNIMLELAVEGENSISPPAVSHNKDNKHESDASERNSKTVIKDELKTGDSFGMLEDDSLIQPDVLNFLDTVESQAIAASQSMKCTPEEIQKKMMEAKKKLAVGKRKRKSQLGCGGTHPGTVVTSKEQVNR